MKRCAVYLCPLALLAAAPAMAEVSFSFNVSNIISHDQPSATVQVWATFGQGDYSFAGGDFDVVASADGGGFSDPHSVLSTFGTSDGQVSMNGDRVNKVVAGQIQFPLGGYNSDTSNPILVWEATWSTKNFGARSVSLGTVTRRFAVYVDDQGNNVDYVHDGFEEGAGSITIVPAPGAGLGLGVLAGVVCGRRRRR